MAHNKEFLLFDKKNKEFLLKNQAETEKAGGQKNSSARHHVVLKRSTTPS